MLKLGAVACACPQGACFCRMGQLSRAAAGCQQRALRARPCAMLPALILICWFGLFWQVAEHTASVMKHCAIPRWFGVVEGRGEQLGSLLAEAKCLKGVEEAGWNRLCRGSGLAAGGVDMSWPLAPTSPSRELRAGEPCGKSLGLGICGSGALGGSEGQWAELTQHCRLLSYKPDLRRVSLFGSIWRVSQCLCKGAAHTAVSYADAGACVGGGFLRASGQP